jgi:hypothetical protein
MELFERALRSRPASPDLLTDYACALHTEGRFDDAEAVLRKAVAIDPTYPNARAVLGCLLLQRENFTEGWDLFEARWNLQEVPMHREIQGPLWDGSSFTGKRLLLHEEQGLGDTIQFIRFAPLINALGGEVLLMCQRPLLDLLSRQRGIDKITASDAPFATEEYDLQCPLMSVARLLRTTPGSIPNQVPYISPDPQLIAKWLSRVAPAGPRRKVGLAWAGNPANAGNATRSIPLSLFESFAHIDNIDLYSLQVGPAAAQIAALPHLRIIDYSREFLNFDETASLIANLDLVISVDTSIAHLAGALGKPVWILLRHSSDWRWLLSGDTSPWYPTARLYRQENAHDWAPVIRKVIDELRKSERA